MTPCQFGWGGSRRTWQGCGRFPITRTIVMSWPSSSRRASGSSNGPPPMLRQGLRRPWSSVNANSRAGNGRGPGSGLTPGGVLRWRSRPVFGRSGFLTFPVSCNKRRNSPGAHNLPSACSRRSCVLRPLRARVTPSGTRLMQAVRHLRSVHSDRGYTRERKWTLTIVKSKNPLASLGPGLLFFWDQPFVHPHHDRRRSGPMIHGLINSSPILPRNLLQRYPGGVESALGAGKGR